MTLVATASFVALGEDKIDHTVIVYPDAKRNKAFQMKNGSAVCNLCLEPVSTWAIRDSHIFIGKDEKTFWKKVDKAHYFFALWYADDEYVKIDGDLYKLGTGAGGAGTPVYPPFTVTVPEVNLQWGADHGDASKEEKEDTVPAVLVVSESKNLFGRLLVHPPKDDFSIETRKCRVTLLWSPADAVKVFKDGTEIGTKTAFDFDSSDAKPVELDVCAVKSAVDVKFALAGEPDNVNKDRAVDYVHAKCVTLNFEVESVAEMPYDDIDNGTLIDSRYATIEVTTDPKGVDVSDLGITFSAVTAEKGDLINHDSKFDVEIEHKAGNFWKTKDKVLWYGILPDREHEYDRWGYDFTLLCSGKKVKTRRYLVEWPERNYTAYAGSMFENFTCPKTPKHYSGMHEEYWYCEIDFKEFVKERGWVQSEVGTDKVILDSYTSQYKTELKSEEEYHLDQFLGAVPRAQGGLDDCFTTNGIKYFVAEQAKYDSKVITNTWIVIGNTRRDAESRVLGVIAKAIADEKAESKRIMDDINTKALMELKAKEQAVYNAAWRYHHCTYQNWPEHPERPVHKAYRSKR